MRQSLRAHLVAAVRAGRGATLLTSGLRAMAARFDVALPTAVRGPLLATWAITWRCPLACAMCDLPARAGTEIRDQDVPRWIDALCDLRPAGLGFTGGEPLVRTVTYAAIERAARRGVVTHLNTSGVPVTAANAARLAGSGLASVNVSIDHDAAEMHDRLRGRPHSQAAALTAIRHLAHAREQAGVRLRLQVMMAVALESLDRVAAVQRLAIDAGADALSILPVHDFGQAAAAGPPPDRDPFAGIPLENSRAYLAGIVPFLAGAATPARCSAPQSAVFVDPRGHLFACTPAATERGAGIPADPERLADLVRAGRLAETVPAGRCTRCWWNCHRELDLAIGTLSPADRPGLPLPPVGEQSR